MSTSDGPVERQNNLRDTITIILRQNIPGIEQLVITQVLLERVKEVVLANMDKIMATLSGALIAIGGGFLLPTILITTINLVGFTSGGVAAGSLAALIQSSVYGAWTGGVFSGLQSIGATAVIAPPVAIGLATTSVVIGGSVLAYQHYKRRKRAALAIAATTDEGGGPGGDADVPRIRWK